MQSPAPPDKPTIVDRLRANAAPITVFVVTLAVYVRTLMPGVSFGDWAEMQTIPHVLGVAHPTGYPTYILLAWLAELPPIGSVAFRANLLSAILVALSLATVVLIARRLGVRPLIAAAAALALGAVGTVWAAATVAEVNPLHLFLSAVLIHRALVWADRRRPVDLLLGGLLLGLAIGNHLLTLFIAPFLLLYVIWEGRRELLNQLWLLPAAIGATILGLSVYLYVPWAASQNPPLPYNHPTTLDGVLWLATGTQFRGQFDFLSPKGPGEFVAALPDLWDLFWSRAAVLFPVVGVIGLVLLVRLRTAFGLTLIGIILGGLYVWANYQQLEHYLLVPFLILGIGAAVGLESLARAVSWLVERLRSDGLTDTSGSAADRRTRSVPGYVIGMAALAFALVLTTMNWTVSDRSDDDSGQVYVNAVFDALPANAAIVSYWDPSAPLWYGHFVEGLRPDVLIVDDTNLVYEGWGSAAKRIASLICTRPIFTIRIGEADLAPLRLSYKVTPFMTVRVSSLGPSAVLNQTVWRVDPLRPC